MSGASFHILVMVPKSQPSVFDLEDIGEHFTLSEVKPAADQNISVIDTEAPRQTF